MGLRMKILLVEDDMRIAHFIIKGLKQEDFVVEHSTDAETGLYLIVEGGGYDLAIITPCYSVGIPNILYNFLNKNYPHANFFVVYETGRFGFWIYREFQKLGIKCMVVNPADIPSTHKEKDKKSDKIDSHKLARELENNNLRPIFVPSEEAWALKVSCQIIFNLYQKYY